MPNGSILHSFEPQLNYRLSLSFIDCEPMLPCDFTFRRRSPEMVEEHERLLAERELHSAAETGA